MRVGDAQPNEASDRFYLWCQCNSSSTTGEVDTRWGYGVDPLVSCAFPLVL